MKKISSFIAAILISAAVFSQSLCEFNALPDTTVCGTAPINLHANVDSVNSTTSYRVDVLPYAIDSSCLLAGSGTDCGIHTDDIHSGVVPIGFTFCFYGSSYNSCLISANGYITFDLTGAGLYSPWPIPGAIPSGATPGYPLNAIMYPWQDILPDMTSVISYQTVGAAPFRKFIVRYDNIMYFSCTTLRYDGMLVLYESTNIIETYIFEKPVCPGWNGGYAIHGIQDATGTQAVVVSGRNYPTVWTDSFNLVRFVPDATPTHSLPLVWTDGTDTIGTGPNVMVVPTDTTTYFAILHVTPECGSGTAFDLIDSCVVNVIPDPFGISAGPDTAICVGDTVSLFVNGTDPITTIQWLPASYITTDTSLTPIAYPLAPTDYIVYAQNAAACVALDTVSVFVGADSIPHSISPDTVLCTGASVPISLVGGTSVSWLPSTGLSDPFISNPIATPGTSTTYYAIFTAPGHDCPGLDSVHVGISTGPDAFFPADISMCAGSGTTLSPYTASGTAVASYLWSTGDITSSISTTSAGLYWVEVTDSAGCTDRDSVTVSLITVVVDAGNDTTVCSGDDVLLIASYDPAATYFWTGGGTVFDPFAQATYVASASTQTYTVTMTINAGSGTVCAASDDVTVFMNSNPIPTLSNDTILCMGDTAQLFASGGSTYDWTPAADISSTIVSNPYVYPSLTTNYVVTITDSVGCAGSGTVVVAIVPLPTIELGADTALCCGGTTTLDAGIGFAHYLWSNGDTSRIATITTSGMYAVTVSDFSGCTATDTRGVGINCILPEITANPGTTIANGNSTDLTVSTSYSGTFSYNWSPTTGLSSPTTNPTTASPSADIAYMVCVTDDNSLCTECDTIEIFVIDTAYITIPNGFTPNGDGLNDLFKPLYDQTITITSFVIYNRWGDAVFNDAANGWDGTYKGADQPVGSYVWMISYTAPDPQSPLTLKSYELQGVVSLIR